MASCRAPRSALSSRRRGGCLGDRRTLLAEIGDVPGPPRWLDPPGGRIDRQRVGRRPEGCVCSSVLAPLNAHRRKRAGRTVVRPSPRNGRLLNLQVATAPHPRSFGGRCVGGLPKTPLAYLLAPKKVCSIDARATPYRSPAARTASTSYWPGTCARSHRVMVRAKLQQSRPLRASRATRSGAWLSA